MNPNRTFESWPLMQMRSEMDRLLHRFFGEMHPFAEVTPFGFQQFPAVNVWEDDEHVFIEAELPGVEQDDIELSVIGKDLLIKGQRAPVEFVDGAVVYLNERPTGPFDRTIRLPALVDEEKIEASLHDGVLLLALPKGVSSRTKRVPIKTIGAR